MRKTGARSVRRDRETVASARSTFSARAGAVRHMNALIRGFRQYFHPDSSPALAARLRDFRRELTGQPLKP